MHPATPAQTKAYWMFFAGTVALLGCALILATDPSTATEQPSAATINVAQVVR